MATQMKLTLKPTKLTTLIEIFDAIDRDSRDLESIFQAITVVDPAETITELEGPARGIILVIAELCKRDLEPQILIAEQVGI